MPKTIAFNLYGTIIDSYMNEEQEIIWVTLANYYELKGVIYTAGELNLAYRTIRDELIGASNGGTYKVGEIFKRLYELKKQESSSEDIANLVSILRDLSTKYIKLHEKALSVLKYLKHQHYTLVAYYDGQYEFAKHDLNKLGIAKYFDQLVCTSEVDIAGKSKDFFTHLTKYQVDEKMFFVSNCIDDIIILNKLAFDNVFIMTKQTGTVANDEIPEDSIYDGNIKAIKKRLK